MKVMILGGAGFRGSTLAAFLVRETNFNVVSVDDLSGTPDLFNLEPVLKAPARHRFYLNDLGDEVIIPRLLTLENPDVIICLAHTSVWHVGNLCRSLKKVNSGAKLLMFGDRADLDYENTVQIQCCQVFGSRQFADRLVPRMISEFFAERDLEGFELNDTKIFEWMYVRDFSTAVLEIIKNGTATSYEVSSGWHYTETDVANVMASIFGSSRKFEINPTRQPDRIFDNAAIQKLGWTPQASFEEALEHTVKWYDLNRWAFRT